MSVHLLLIKPMASGRTDPPIVLAGKTLTDLAHKFELYALANQDKMLDYDDEQFREEILELKSDIMDGIIPKHPDLTIIETMQYLQTEL